MKESDENIFEENIPITTPDERVKLICWL